MRLKTFGPAIALTLIGFLIAWQFVNPAPPHTITIATYLKNTVVRDWVTLSLLLLLRN